MILKAEYVWIDGHEPWGLRSKVKVISNFSNADLDSVLSGDVSSLPEWGFDGSSTLQADGDDSDCLLKPVYATPDPLRDENSILVMCEVLNADGSVHATNKRAALDGLIASHSLDQLDPWFGIEQEFTIIDDGRPLGFPANGYPAPQGMYYCSAGGDRAFGREISDDHMEACIEAGIAITGTNAEVMPGQWEYQVGGPGIGAKLVSDQLWISRWLLLKIAEAYGMTVTFDAKPMLGDWNGAGAHTNFSTNTMRADGGMKVIEEACEKLGTQEARDRHLAAYGTGTELRLTGAHETCSWDEYKYGIADRTASIRIPRGVANDGKGYLEDRRPNANCDPYEVTRVLLETCCT
ncbi:MAG: glutamine synthetase beta-grasp domain-containing protein [Myxococcota bacterium]|nr:glutamine synthetase beta-grasp domain-containing protein [Myxococcota bacterium]